MSDLIVKGAGEIKDGLYNIKDGKLFKYKANGGTVRTYPIIEAGWTPCSERLPKEPRGNREIENYLTCDENGHIYIFSWANGWNCCFNSDGSLYKDQEITDIVAWMPLPEAYKESDADGSD